MKKFALLLCFIISSAALQAQETFLVDGASVDLEREADGKLDLFWKIIDREYRYFVKTETDELIELKNTKADNGEFQHEYKNVLARLTEDANLPVKHLKFKRSSLKAFVDNYNKISDNTYQAVPSTKRVNLRFGVFGGITNSPFTSNPENVRSGQFGAELEILDNKKLTRSALFLQAKHVLEHDDFAYSTTEIALGYRFRIINTKAFSFYAETKFATLSFSEATVTTIDEDEMPEINNIKETSFDIPLIIGVGADVRLSSCSLITLGYNQLFAILIDNQGNFSTDFTIGYKFEL